MQVPHYELTATVTIFSVCIFFRIFSPDVRL